MEKESCTKFCGVLLSSHEVMKFRKFESATHWHVRVSWWIDTEWLVYEAVVHM